MERVNAILNHSKYRLYISNIEEREKNREFCKHNLEHFLSVARICYILSLEEKLNIDKEIIYGASLLHDIGRYLEYEKNIPHDEGSVILSKEILEECDFKTSEIDEIIRAIKNHREETISTNSLSYILYLSDKLSRECFCCEAIDKCYWKKEIKNITIKY